MLGFFSGLSTKVWLAVCAVMFGLLVSLSLALWWSDLQSGKKTEKIQELEVDIKGWDTSYKSLANQLDIERKDFKDKMKVMEDKRQEEKILQANQEVINHEIKIYAGNPIIVKCNLNVDWMRLHDKAASAYGLPKTGREHTQGTTGSSNAVKDNWVYPENFNDADGIEVIAYNYKLYHELSIKHNALIRACTGQPPLTE